MARDTIGNEPALSALIRWIRDFSPCDITLHRSQNVCLTMSEEVKDKRSAGCGKGIVERLQRLVLKQIPAVWTSKDPVWLKKPRTAIII